MIGLLVFAVFVNSQCLSAPFLYATYHDTPANVQKWSRDGCDLGLVLGAAPSPVQELRSVKVTSSGELIVADSYTSFSQLLLYSTCSTSGQRTFKASISNETSNAGLDHPYGVDVAASGDIYVSNQHTDNVLRFAANGYAPIPFPAYINSTSTKGYYPGTFYQFGSPGEHSSSEQGVRSLAFVGDNLWIANEDINGVVVVDPNGNTIEKLNITSPIGLYYDSSNGVVFAGSKASPGKVVAYNAKTYASTQTYTHSGMTHPAGIVSYGGVVYVADQDLGQLLSFDQATGAFQKVLITFKYQVEQLALSPC